MADTLFGPRSDAVLSPCGTYRYLLTREWGDHGSAAATFIMLNPSTADADRDDPTIQRCIRFAQAWGCGALRVVNLYAIRATDPKVALAHPEPIGYGNPTWLYDSCDLAAINGWPLIAAWGNNAPESRVRTFVDLLGKSASHLSALGVTSSGAPKHPLARGRHRIPDDALPTPWRLREAADA